MVAVLVALNTSILTAVTVILSASRVQVVKVKEELEEEVLRVKSGPNVAAEIGEMNTIVSRITKMKLSFFLITFYQFTISPVLYAM